MEIDIEEYLSYQSARANHADFRKKYEESGSNLPFNEWCRALSHPQTPSDNLNTALAEITDAIMNIDPAEYRAAIEADKLRVTQSK